MLIYLVDDDGFSRELTGVYLEVLEAKVELLSSGRECLDLVARQPPDLILMDCQLPEMDGYETVRHLRQSGYTGSILALTANSDKSTLKRCKLAGMNGHIPKPVDENVLRSRIEDCLRKRRPPSKKTRSNPEGLAQTVHPSQTCDSINRGQRTSHGQTLPPAHTSSSVDSEDKRYPGRTDPLARIQVVSQSRGDQNLMNHLIQSFIDSSEESIQRIQVALDNHDRSDLLGLTHQLRGAAGAFGASDFSQAAGQVEDELKHNSLEKSAGLVHQLLKMWGPLRAYLESSQS